MQQINLLQKKNYFISFSYIVFFLLYCTLVALGIFTFNLLFTLSSSLCILLLMIFFYLKVSAKVIQIYLIVSLNVLILLLICKSFYIINLYWLIFYLILIGLYQSVPIIVTSSINVTIQIVIISFYQVEFSLAHIYEIKILLLLALMAITIGIIQTIFIQLAWRINDKKSSKERQDLLSQQAYLQLFFEYANDAIAVFGLDNNIIEVNPAFEKLYGWSREESIGHSLPLVPPKRVQEANERFHQLIMGQSFTIVSDEMKKDGTIFIAQISLSPLYNKDGTVMAISVITRDISYMKENERLLMQSEKLKLAGEIAAGVAHEIRNPMTVISGFIQIMEADENSAFKDYVAIIQDEIERIDLIISEFLVLSRPQIETKDRIDLVQILNEIIVFYQLELQNRDITIQHQPSIQEAFIYGNKNQLKQVFINIIKNAIEAINSNGQISIAIVKQHQSYMITIKDNGCGIPAHILDSIFEPFYTTKSKGTGLGMMITNKIIQDHQGTIKVFSKEHVGTDIHIHFPLNNID